MEMKREEEESVVRKREEGKEGKEEEKQIWRKLKSLGKVGYQFAFPRHLLSLSSSSSSATPLTFPSFSRRILLHGTTWHWLVLWTWDFSFFSSSFSHPSHRSTINNTDSWLNSLQNDLQTTYISSLLSFHSFFLGRNQVSSLSLFSLPLFSILLSTPFLLIWYNGLLTNTNIRLRKNFLSFSFSLETASLFVRNFSNENVWFFHAFHFPFQEIQMDFFMCVFAFELVSRKIYREIKSFTFLHFISRIKFPFSPLFGRQRKRGRGRNERERGEERGREEVEES